MKIKRKYLKETKEILNELFKKPTFNFYVDLCDEGVFIETRMLPSPDCPDCECYKNIRIEISTLLVLSEILDALFHTPSQGARFCKDGVECFTLQYNKKFRKKINYKMKEEY